jgi:zinc/manganese transport system substrate-binding protein
VGAARYIIVLVALLATVALTGCGAASSAAPDGRIVAVGAENEYANVIAQIGGRYVQVSAILSNPNTDPHTFEASASVAETVSRARLIVENGLGYDDFMTEIENAAGGSAKVINVQRLLGLPQDSPNPHLWYSPHTMPALAHALVAALSQIQPAHAAYFDANERRFDRSLEPWLRQLEGFSLRYPRTAVATTEPVADYMLQAAGITNLTPFSLQAAIMNGTDPAPQSLAYQDSLFAHHRVKVFVYNQQVTDTITQGFLSAARAAGIPVVGVYETMPVPGYDYQTWMLAEIRALQRAVADRSSTERLGT